MYVDVRVYLRINMTITITIIMARTTPPEAPPIAATGISPSDFVIGAANRKIIKRPKWDDTLYVLPKSLVRHTLQPLCDLSATDNFHQSQRSQQGSRSVPARLRRSWRLVGDLAATKSVAARFLSMLKRLAATDLVADRSWQSRRLLCNLAGTDRRPCCDLCDRWKLSVAERSQSGCNVCLTGVLGFTLAKSQMCKVRRGKLRKLKKENQNKHSIMHPICCW